MQNIKLSKFAVVFLLICIALSNGQVINERLLAALVPRIDQPGFKLNPTGQRYTLTINLPDGSNRIEDVELLAPGTPDEELHVMGTSKEIFPIGTAVTIYEAGRNGYTVKYKYVRVSPVGPFFISPTGLKSASG